MKFNGVDTLEEALMEIVDLSNYARYTFIKIRLLQIQVAALSADISLEQIPQGFISLRRD